MSEAKTLYKSDFAAWAREQAEALRSVQRGGSNQALDWENLAEEIESLAISQLHLLKSQIRRVIEHLLKLEYSRAADPRSGWIDSIDDARNEIESVLEESPSLKNEIDAAIAAEMKRGSRRAISALETYGELNRSARDGIRARTYSTEQIIGEWLPPEPERETPAARDE